MKAIALLFLSLHGVLDSRSAEPDTLEGRLPGVVVEATRSAETSRSAPFAVTLISRPIDEITVESGTSLQDVLASTPGVWINDRGHFAMGERIIIRGTGWRSAFGVRGVMVVLDGVPLTMPDGQAFADVVEPALIRSAEIIRGPASVFWGNASGGVIFLRTDPRATDPTIRLRGMVGTHGERQLLGETRIPLGNGRLSLYGSHIGRDGFRPHSDGSFQRGGAHVQMPFGARTLITANVAGALQDSRNPGGLTSAQVADNRAQVDSVYIRNVAGKESLQLQAVIAVDHELPFATLAASVYGVRRDLENPLIGRYVAVDRIAGGGRVNLSGSVSALRWALGGDLGRQSDDRANFANQAGDPGPDHLLDQQEIVTNAAAFGYIAAAVVQGLELSAGLRADAVHFRMEDRLLENGDESGSRRFAAFSPTLGVGYRFGNALTFVNYATAFETPTTTELVNRPDLTGGFNPDLSPEYSQGIEVGVRGSVPGPAGLSYEVALHRSSVRNLLVQQQTEDGRDYYRNAGTNRHRGAEASIALEVADALTFQASYALNDLTFRTGDIAGNALPGVPRHRGYGRATWDDGRIRFSASAEAISSYYADEANAAENDGYLVLSANLSHAGILVDRARIRPFVEVENVLDTEYNASVVVNAFGGRYYEPAAGRVLRVGVHLSL